MTLNPIAIPMPQPVKPGQARPAGPPIVIIGAGGHGRVVLEALRRGGATIEGFADDDPDRKSTRLNSSHYS